MLNGKKLIGITTQRKPFSTTDIVTHPLNSQEVPALLPKPFYKCLTRLVNWVIGYNCVPILLTYENLKVDDYLSILDGIVLAGDLDLPPHYYRQEDRCTELHATRGMMDDNKMRFQMEVFNEILLKKTYSMPVLCICAGMQALNVFLGGDLIQDIHLELGSNIEHTGNGNVSPDLPSHEVEIIQQDSLLFDIVKRTNFGVNSFHHQALNHVPDSLKITAKAPDGVIEAVEYIADPEIFCLGTQWHVERLTVNEDKLISNYFFAKCGAVF